MRREYSRPSNLAIAVGLAVAVLSLTACHVDFSTPCDEMCGGDTCIDLSTDTNNCGGCGQVCGGVDNASFSCVAAQCQAECNQGFDACMDSSGATSCVDTQTDTSHCGRCGMACPAGDSCTGGRCVSSCGDACSVAPAVVSTTPADSATGVAIDAIVTATFSEGILAPDTSNVTMVDSNNNVVAGSVTYDSSSFTLTFTPTNPLTEFETAYTVTISGVESLAGIPMAQPFSWSVTTALFASNYHYRWYESWDGPNWVLDTFADDDETYEVAPSENTSGSFWYMTDVGGGAYMMQNVFGGSSMALEGGDGSGPALLTGLVSPGQPYTGQEWTFTASGGPGSYRLQNMNLGTGWSLDIYGGNMTGSQAVMHMTQNSMGQQWTAERSSQCDPTNGC